jgi:hypothetical protein
MFTYTDITITMSIIIIIIIIIIIGINGLSTDSIYIKFVEIKFKKSCTVSMFKIVNLQRLNGSTRMVISGLYNYIALESPRKFVHMRCCNSHRKLKKEYMRL